MEENKNYIKLVIANRIRLFSIIFLFFCVWVGVFSNREIDLYRIFCIFILIFADIAVYCLMTYWRNWIVLEKCDVHAQEKSQLSLLKWKRYKEDVHLHKNLLMDRLVLGKYDESKQEIDELHRLDSQLKPAQRLEVQLLNIDYMIAVNETASLNTALENAKNALMKLSDKNDRIKQKYQISIRLLQYLIEERWEDLHGILKEIPKKDMPILGQVIIAFYHGQCFYHLGRYEEGFYELRFAARYGGNTKYVTLANELIEKMSEKNLYESKSAEQTIKVKHRIDKTVIILAISCILLIFSIGFNRYCSHGNSIEEAYRRRYFCTQDDLTIFYQKKIGNYELVIMHDGKNEAYCLFEETGSDYKIVESYCFDRNFGYGKNHMEPELTESDKEFYQESMMSLETWSVITGFYKQNNIFHQEDMAYVGICSFPIAENAVVNGNPVSVEQVIYIDETAVYLWSVENVDLKTNIQVDYIAE